MKELKVINYDVKPVIPEANSIAVVGKNIYHYDTNNREVSLGGDTEPPAPITGNDRQVIGFDENREQLSLNLQWKHFSDEAVPPSANLNALIYSNQAPQNDKFIFSPITSEKVPFAIVMRDADGNFEGSEIIDDSVKSVNGKEGPHVILNNTDVGADPVGSSTTAFNNSKEYTDTAIENLKVGQAGGLAILDSTGKLPSEMLNISGLQFKGAWDPNTNTPELIDGTGSVGDFYKASHAGSFNTGNGTFTYVVGDWIIYAGGTWQRIGSADTVSMVNGKLGNVVLTAADVGALPNTYTPPNAPVQSVNGKVGDVVIGISDINTLQTSLDGKMNVPSTTFSVPVRGSSVTGGSLPYTSAATINTFPVRNSNGTFSVTEPTVATNVATKNYIDTLKPITSTTAGWRVREYSDRIEYSRKITYANVNVGTGGGRYHTHDTGVNSPTGINTSNADEHYLSLENFDRAADVCVFQADGTGTFRIGIFNNYNTASAITVRGNVFVKLVRYK